MFSAGYSHPKAAALQQIVKPDPASQPSTSGRPGGDACPPPCGRPLKKKWMQDHEQAEQRMLQDQEQRLQEEKINSVKVEAKVEAKGQTRDPADGKVSPRGGVFHCAAFILTLTLSCICTDSFISSDHTRFYLVSRLWIPRHRRRGQKPS